MLGVACFWFVLIGTDIMQQLHRFMIAVSRVAVNHDGKGSAPDPLVWDHGGRKKVRRTDIRVNVEIVSLPGPHGFLFGPWMQVHGSCITGADVAWPHSVGISRKFTAFLGTWHWLVDAVDVGHLGVSLLEVLILFERWAGHRLLSEKVTRPHVRANRSILIPSVPVSEGIEIRHMGANFSVA